MKTHNFTIYNISSEHYSSSLSCCHLNPVFQYFHKGPFIPDMRSIQCSSVFVPKISWQLCVYLILHQTYIFYAVYLKFWIWLLSCRWPNILNILRHFTLVRFTTKRSSNIFLLVNPLLFLKSSFCRLLQGRYFVSF